MEEDEEDKKFFNFTYVNATEALQKKGEEDMKKFLKEGLQYAAEMVYFVWLLLSISLCSGIFVENPVQERLHRIRYYLNVLGLPQLTYWLGNIAFDYFIFLIQAAMMLILVQPLNLEAYSTQYTDYTMLLLAFGFAHCSFSYMVSFWFSTPQSALKAFSFIYLIAGFFLPFLFKNVVLFMYGCDAYHYFEIIIQFIPL